MSKEELFRQADIVTIHLVLSRRTRGLVGAADLALMKPTARLVNTSRGPIVVEADLLEALRNNKIAGAAVDVFDQEPLPLDHPFRNQSEPAGNSAHRLRFAWPLSALLSGYGRQHSQVARHPNACCAPTRPREEAQWLNAVTLNSPSMAATASVVGCSCHQDKLESFLPSPSPMAMRA